MGFIELISGAFSLVSFLSNTEGPVRIIGGMRPKGLSGTSMARRPTSTNTLGCQPPLPQLRSSAPELFFCGWSHYLPPLQSSGKGWTLKNEIAIKAAPWLLVGIAWPTWGPSKGRMEPVAWVARTGWHERLFLALFCAGYPAA